MIPHPGALVLARSILRGQTLAVFPYPCTCHPAEWWVVALRDGVVVAGALTQPTTPTFGQIATLPLEPAELLRWESRLLEQALVEHQRQGLACAAGLGVA